MATLDQSYATPLAAITQASRDNARLPNLLGQRKILPDSVDTTIDYKRWNKLYPYALVVARKAKNDLSLYVDLLKSVGSGGTVTYKDALQLNDFYRSEASFVLPIPPEQLTIQTPYAIQVSKTLRGVVEEHNADPFKVIAFTGTTGTNPLRHISRTVSSANLLGGIVDAARGVSNTLGFSSTIQSPTDTDILEATGYGQFKLLEVFLQSYVRMKAAGDKDLRLIFVSYKDQRAYVVTPMQFTLRREAGRALKYRYDLQFKGWKEMPSRKILSGGGLSSALGGVSWLGAALGKCVQILDTVRKTIAGVVSIVKNIRAAVNRLLDIVREVSLAIKEAINAVISIIDLPAQLIRDIRSAFIQSWAQIKGAWDDLGDSFRQAKADLDVTKEGNLFGTTKGLGQLIKPQGRFVDKYFEDPSSLEAQTFLSICDISTLSLPPAIQAKIQAEKDRVAAFTNEDYARMRDEVRTISAQIADTIGASNATYDVTYQNIYTSVVRTPTQGDWDAVFAINDVLRVMNALSQKPSTLPTTMEYVAGMASKSGIAFQVPVSKYAVPFPYDYTLEEVARQYLGNPDRWLEIATLNGLREPYVDEVGFTLPLLGNGKLSEVTVSNSTNLVINQPIWIQSNAVNREKRHILNITNVGPGNTVLTLDGPGDLAKYLAVDNPYIQAFLPDTVNSHQVLYIPSDKPSSANEELASIPGVDAFDSLIEVGGVDMLLTSDNDLAITEDGDCRVAYGMQNLIQRARIALATPQGSLIRHPTFGLPIKVGMSVADLDIQELKAAVGDIFASDPDFQGVTTVSVQQNAATLQIGLGLAVTGQKYPLSLAFQVKR
jgi:hypothetical protein